MCNYIRQINISLLVLSLLLNAIITIIAVITSIFLISIISDKKLDFQEAPSTFVYLSIAVIKGTIAFITVNYFGKRVIYFKMLSYFKIYVIFIVLYMFISALLVVLNFMLNDYNKGLVDERITHFLHLRNCIMIIAIVNIICDILTLTFTGFYYKRLIYQFEESPLNRISNPEDLSNELYNNIISQSKDPENNTLKEEYRRLSHKAEYSKQINSSSVY